VRDPAWHIASLMKQHALFCEGEQRNPLALRHMQRVGHFEFGLDRRPINAGDAACVAEVAALWACGEEVEGWARYWSHIHGYLADRLAEAAAHELHEFWPDEVSSLDARRIDRSRVHGPQQLTDAYLLALAVARGGRLVTFDRPVAVDAVVGAAARRFLQL
jgi:hypothetical protein